MSSFRSRVAVITLMGAECKGCLGLFQEMPEGLLKPLKNDKVRNLIAYLRTTVQVPLPKP